MKIKNKKGSVAVITAIIVIVAITAGVIGYLFAKKSQSPDKQEVVSQQSARSEEGGNGNAQKDPDPVPEGDTDEISASLLQAVSSEDDWRTYRNGKYGFSLDFPESWKSYNVSYWTNMDGEMTGFNLLDKGASFNLGIYSKEKWDNEASKWNPKPIKIAERNNNIFFYTTFEDGPGPISKEEQGEVENIVKTFKFIDTDGDLPKYSSKDILARFAALENTVYSLRYDQNNNYNMDRLGFYLAKVFKDGRFEESPYVFNKNDENTKKFMKADVNGDEVVTGEELCRSKKMTCLFTMDIVINVDSNRGNIPEDAESIKGCHGGMDFDYYEGEGKERGFGAMCIRETLEQ